MISLPMGNSNSNLQVAIGRLRERVCRRDEAEGGEARRRRRPRAFSCVEGARWNWVNTGWKRARPTCKASRELGTPGRYTGRSNSIEWRAPFPSQKHFLFVLSRISTSASFLPFPFLSYPILSYPILFCPPFVRKTRQSIRLSIQIETISLTDSPPFTLPFHFVVRQSGRTRSRIEEHALPCRARVLHISSVTSGTANDKDRSTALRLPPTNLLSLYPTDLFIPANIPRHGVRFVGTRFETLCLDGN